jgi:predicted permease
MIGRLRSGFTVDQARAEMVMLLPSITQSRAPEFRITDSGLRSRLTYLGWAQLNDFANLVPVFIVCGLVFLIACSNLANVQLARALSRRHEIGVRLSLGASRGRIVRQLLTEALPIAIGGGAAGLVLAHWTLDLIQKVCEPLLRVPLFELTPDFRVLAAALLLSGLAAVLFGLVPALQTTRPNLSSALKGVGRIFSLRTGRSGIRRPGIGGPPLGDTLVVVQFALSLALLAGAGILLVRTRGLEATRPGLDTTNTLAIDLSANIDDPALPARLCERLTALPGVVSVARQSQGPLGYKGGLWGALPEASVYLSGNDSDQRSASCDSVSAEYFSTVGLAIIRGRPFTRRDTESHAPAAVISNAAAQHFWPGEDPIGKQFRISKGTHEGDAVGDAEVVGVAQDAVNGSVFNGPAAACVYLPLPRTAAGGFLVVRVAGGAGRWLASIRAAISSAEPAAVFDLATLAELRSTEILPYRIMSSLAAALGLLALLLASIGIYGAVAYLVNRRTREIGVRMALGARPADVLMVMVIRGCRLILISIGLGLVASWEFCHVLAAFVSNLNATDVRVFLGSTVILATVGLFATYLPARKSTSVDPSVALRYE